jgi:hypothetical protein
LNHFTEQISDEKLTEQINSLTETLFAKAPLNIWNGDIMASRLRKHRKTALPQQQKQTQLPLLNP